MAIGLLWTHLHSIFVYTNVGGSKALGIFFSKPCRRPPPCLSSIIMAYMFRLHHHHGIHVLLASSSWHTCFACIIIMAYMFCLHHHHKSNFIFAVYTSVGHNIFGSPFLTTFLIGSYPPLWFRLSRKMPG
jgi:hypothetical protein